MIDITSVASSEHGLFPPSYDVTTPSTTPVQSDTRSEFITPSLPCLHAFNSSTNLTSLISDFRPSPSCSDHSSFAKMSSPYDAINATKLNQPAVGNMTSLYDFIVANGLNLSWTSSDVDGLPLSSRIVLIFVYTLATVLSVVGNIVVIVVFVAGQRSRTDLRVYLINLAAADLVMAVFCMPFTFTMTMLNTWVFGKPMCPVVLYMQLVSVTASVGTNMAIGVDRYMVVMFPLRSRITKARSRFVIAGVWVISLGLSAIQLYVGEARTVKTDSAPTRIECQEVWPGGDRSIVYRRTYTFFVFLLTYLLPLTILGGTYSFLGRKLWRRSAPGNADRSRDIQQFKSKCKVIKMLLFIVLLFAICWLPLHTFNFLLDFHPDLMDTREKEELLIAIFYIVHWLAMSNSFVNPIIYSFLNDNFRRDLLGLLIKCFPCCARCAGVMDSSDDVKGGAGASRYYLSTVRRHASSQRTPSMRPSKNVEHRHDARGCQGASSMMAGSGDDSLSHVSPPETPLARSYMGSSSLPISRTIIIQCL